MNPEVETLFERVLKGMMMDSPPGALPALYRLKEMASRPEAMAHKAWIPLAERMPKDEDCAYLVTDGIARWVESADPSWWNTKDPRGKEFDGPTITHWIEMPSAPENDTKPDRRLGMNSGGEKR